MIYATGDPATHTGNAITPTARWRSVVASLLFATHPVDTYPSAHLLSKQIHPNNQPRMYTHIHKISLFLRLRPSLSLSLACSLARSRALRPLTLTQVHTEAVSGVVGRAEVLAALFFLCSLLCYMRRQVVACVMFAGLSMVSVEQGAMECSCECAHSHSWTRASSCTHVHVLTHPLLYTLTHTHTYANTAHLHKR